MSQPLHAVGDFSALVVLLPDLDPIVGRWRARFDAGVAEVGAHVSVLVPWIAPDEITAADLDALAQLARSWDRFEVSFARFEVFPAPTGPSVHWLAPEPAEPFLALTDDLVTGWPEYLPYQGAHGPESVPHLTLSSTGSSEELAPMFAAVSEQLPITSTATALSVLEVRDGRSRTRASFRFGGKGR